LWAVYSILLLLVTKSQYLLVIQYLFHSYKTSYFARKSGLFRWVSSLDRDNLPVVVFYYLMISASEISTMYVCTLYVHAEWSLRYGVDFWSDVIEKKIYCNIYFFFVSMQGDKIYLFLWPVCWQSFNAKIIFLWVSWYIFQQLVYQEQIFLSQVHFNHIRCTFYSDWATFNILS
jgi:hypothetical protein